MGKPQGWGGRCRGPWRNDFVRDMIPKKLRILGRNFAVKIDSTMQSDEGSIGHVSYNHQDIRLGARAGLPVRESTLLHEVLHVVDVAMELGLSHSQISGVATGLYQVFADNGTWIERTRSSRG